MKKTKIALSLIVLSYLAGCSNIMIAKSDDSKIIKEAELWKMEFVKLKELLPKEEWPLKGAVIIAYHPEKNEGIMHFMYEDRTVKISIIKENETDYVLNYKGKTLVGYGQELKGGAILCIYLFADKKEKDKDLPLRKNLQNRDGICKRKNIVTVEEMLKEMREQAKFAEEEQAAFEKDPPIMMKGGK